MLRLPNRREFVAAGLALSLLVASTPMAQGQETERRAFAKTYEQMEEELRIAGWTGFDDNREPEEVAVAYARTTARVSQNRNLGLAGPRGLWPAWISGVGRVWTAIGSPEGGPQSLVAPDGSWEATTASPLISIWVVADGTLHQPNEARWSLVDGHLPLVASSWTAPNLRISGLIWQEADTAQWQLQIHNDGPAREVAVYVAVRPYLVQTGVKPIRALGVQGATVVADGRPVLTLPRPPNVVRASSGAEGDISVNLRSERASVEDPDGFASLAVVYDLRLAQGETATLAFAAPTGERAAAISAGPEATAERWRVILRPGQIEVPERRVTDAYYASLAYVLMSHDDGVLHPGPLLHNAFWYRDSTYMLEALGRNGNLQEARRFLEPFTRFQSADGEFVPIVSAVGGDVGRRLGETEWDSQGQGIHALVEHYRFAKDEAWLRNQWPSIDRAARFMERLIAEDGSGLLPPGWSAEDLGPPEDRHFWDDFWGVIGFRDAAIAADVVGDARRAEELRNHGEALLQATLSAGEPGRLRQKGMFPNGPESTLSSADARGTTPAVWPGRLLSDDLARSLFSAYYDEYIRIGDGGFQHGDGWFWPFGGLEIAHASLFAGLPDQAQYILAWTLDRPTAPGVWAWADEVNADGNELRNGDMPHTWVAAEYMALIRDMLVYEKGDSLQLAAGVPAEWLGDGQRVAITDRPTYFGPLSYALERAGSTVTLDLRTSSPPAGGFELHLPYAIASFATDGGEVVPAGGISSVHLAPQVVHVEIYLLEPVG